MRILVCEYFSGVRDSTAADALVAEGKAMLAAVVGDFRRLGEHEVATVAAAGPGGFIAAFRDGLRWAEAALVIAPETGGILGWLSAEVEATGCLLLGSASGAVAVAADKLATGRLLAEGGVLTPPCRAVDAGGSGVYPSVIKPLDGCGAAGVWLVRNHGERAEALRRLLPGGACLEQPYVEGLPASVSLLVGAGGRAQALSLNRQMIELVDGQLVDCGHPEPLATHPLAARARSAAVAASRLIPGLRGFVGVDVVLTDTDVWVIEVNPRVTSAYMAVRRVCPFNLMGAVLDAAIAPGAFAAW
jgi:predicted ATP-grasp superfamily ATP-dependent carboligase